jgi:hypothetical protein
MSGELNSVVSVLTGPRRLRSALRQKTASINRLLDGLSGPTELCVQIPAAVFGGDIFGVMSTQLREALIVPPQAPVSQATAARRRLSNSSADFAFQNHQNPSPLIVDRATRSTQRASFASELTSRSSIPQSEPPLEQRPVNQFSRPETGISRKGIGARLFDESSVRSVKPSIVSTRSSTTKPLTLTPTLVSSLNRYWQTVRESRNATHLMPQSQTESRADAASRPDTSRPVTDAEQQTASRAWPNLVGRDVSEKLRSFSDPNRSLKPTRLSSNPDRQIQNVFNIEVNHANQLASNYSDLGERIAEILHEQALQHGIDIT